MNEETTEKLHKKFEEETRKNAVWHGEETKNFKKWLSKNYPNIVEVRKEKREKEKLMLNPSNSPLKAKQLIHILQKTPKNHIYDRPGRGGKRFDYVTGVYMKKVLNYVFGWMWNFEIKEHGREGDQVWVQGELTAKIGDKEIVKNQFGRASIKFYKDKSKGMVDFGNDLKAAATDALKKCASELGIASDVYGANEFKDIQAEDPSFQNAVEVETKKSTKKVEELKSMLKGKTNKTKMKDLKERTGTELENLDGITESYAGKLIAKILNNETK